MKFPVFLILLFFASTCFSQKSLDSIAHLNYQLLHETLLNDVWGYVDGSGNEYALVGARKGTSVVSLADPSNPVEVHWEPGMESVWRDLKTWKSYAYITTEAENGLLILDLSSLPDASQIQSYFYFGEVGNNWKSAHNLYIDSAGYAYIFGANRGNGGVIILDLNQDPLNPVEVGQFDDWYCHDGYVLNDTLFGAHIYEGVLSMIDVRDRSNPVLLGTKETPSNFAHNIWTTANGDYGFTTDEKSNGYLASFDLRDPANIVELDRIQSSPGAKVVPHNAHVLGDFLITSYYSDGVTIHDISRPHNIVQTGYYDTYPDQTIGTDGCWGVYPFLPSGLIIATDIEEGLFILNPDYQHACFVEGKISDSGNGNAIQNAEVTIESFEQLNYSDFDGNYGTGHPDPGFYTISVSKVGYYPKTINNVELKQNIVNVLDIQLDPIPQFQVEIKLVDAVSQNPIIEAPVRLTGSKTVDEVKTDGLGIATISLFYEEDYELIAGKWGHVTHCSTRSLQQGVPQMVIELTPGIYDDFSFDFGWKFDENIEHGAWERGVPFGTNSNSAPSADVEEDCGESAYVTGNSPDPDPIADEVENAVVTLTSPIFDASQMTEPVIKFRSWFYNFHGVAPFDDTLSIYLSKIIPGGSEEVLIHQQYSKPEDFFFWHDVTVRIRDFMEPGDQMSLIVTTSDFEATGNITEAGFDHFRVVEESSSGLFDLSENQVHIFPNPGNGYFTIQHLTPGTAYQLQDHLGRKVLTGRTKTESELLDIRSLKAGIYYLSWKTNQSGKVQKLIKID
ncbi:MAG: choice-of-anchor B family protein [Bacteroidetes bacterium]|nr:MAG: choice-of-anchor B family protein [Bacteroidota bacterium]